jgi:hypothetical protein
VSIGIFAISLTDCGTEGNGEILLGFTVGVEGGEAEEQRRLTGAATEQRSLKDDTIFGVILGSWVVNHLRKLSLGQTEESGALKDGNFIKGIRLGNFAIFSFFEHKFPTALKGIDSAA